MSDTIQGAKSRSYIKNDPIPGIENCQDSLEYNTVQELSGNRGGIDAVIHGSYTVSTGHSVEAGSVKRLIKSTAHGAKKGWIMRPTVSREEIAIVKIVDANNFVISDFFPDISIADTFDICRFVTPNYTEDGDLNVVVTASGPVQFIKDTVITTVEEDTAAPANNEPLPSKIFIQKDGVTYPVNKDTGVPGNTVAVPVEIVGVSGQEINITAGDINIQTTSEGGSFDSMRIGSGVGLYAGITANSELSVHDQDVLDAIDLLAKLTDTQPVSIAGTVAVSGPLTDVQLRAAPVPVSLAAVPLPAGAATEATLALIKAKTDNLDVALSTRNLEATQLLIKAKTDNLDVALSTRNLEATQLLIKAKTDNLDVALSTVSKEATLGLMSAKLPATLGTKTAALSLAVTPSSDGVFNTSQTPQGLSTFVTQVVTDAVVSTFTVPAGAKRMVVYNNADASGANRVRRGNVAVPPAWPSTGPLLGVGSFTSEIPATTFTVIAEDNSATANISVEYFY